MATEKLLTLSTLTYYDGKIKTYIGEKDNVVLQSAKDYADGLVTEYSIVKAETAEDGYAATYNMTKDGEVVGTSINIPKDYLVKSASIKTVETADAPVTGYKVGDKYIDFVVNSVDDEGNESHLYLLVTELVDAYTAGVGIEISADNVVSLVVQDGTKEVGGITDEDYTEFKGAVTTANDNKTAIEAINNADTGILATAKSYADERDAVVQGEIDALETLVGTLPESATATDVVGYAEELVTALEAKGYDDTEVRGLISGNTDAIAEVKATADGAVQEVASGTANGTIAVDGTDVAVTGLGGAAYKAEDYYEVAGAGATAEENAKAYADELIQTNITDNQVTDADIDALFA